MSKHRFATGVIALLVAVSSSSGAPPKVVVFMIGDGMGLNHVKAGGMYLHGAPGTLSFESLPYKAEVTTYSASSSITDSAASSTAMATATKVNNGVISLATPGDGRELLTLLELYKARGVRVGLVTSDAMTGATPAGFGAHEADRDNSGQIAGDYLNQTRPNVLLGGGGSGMTTAAAIAAGYSVVTNRTGLLGINTNTVELLSGQFGTGSMPYEYDGAGSLPHLSDMASIALDILDNDANGFFLMIESGNIDHAAHSNDIVRHVREVVEFQNTVQLVMNWAAGRNDTLLVVTADHETGGMSTPINNGQGNAPTVTWSTTGHSAANVGAWAWGVNAQYVTGTIDNTHFFRIIGGPEPSIALLPASAAKATPWARNPAPPADTFSVRNIGNGTLAYNIGSDAEWVRPEPASGSCTIESDTISLVYNTVSLAPGTYTAHLDVTGSDPATVPQTFTLTLTVGPVPGDFNDDGDVDQEDYGHLQVCFTSIGVVAPPCNDADLDHDHDVDQNDFTLLQRCWSGADTPATPTCTN